MEERNDIKRMRGFGKPAPPDAADSPALIASGSTWSAMAQSQGFSNEELARHAIWGMPAVNYDLTFQNGGPRGYGRLQPGHLQCRKRPCGSKHLICTLFRKQIRSFPSASPASECCELGG